MVAVAMATTLLISCSESPTEQDAPQTTVQQANDSLSSMMNTAINQYFDNSSPHYQGTDSSFRPRDLDFTGVNAMYRAALNNDPTSVDAKFGVAMTGFLIYLSDPEFNALLDGFKHVLDTMTFNPFNPTVVTSAIYLPGPMSPEGVPLNSAGLLTVIPSATYLERGIVHSAAQAPSISQLQANMENKLLPKLVEARKLMIEIAADPNFKFYLTPEMQGNEGADTLIFDQSVAKIILAGLYGAEATIHIFIARNLDLPEYTIAAANNAMAQSSDFLNLKASGAANMSTAGDRILAGIIALTSGVNSLLDEIRTGADQSRDFLQVDAYDSARLLEIRDTLISMETSMTAGPRLLALGDYNSLLITVDIRKFFDEPMYNPKLFAPDYTVTLSELPDLYKTYADQRFSRTLYWSNLYDIFGVVEPNDTPIVPVHLPETNTDDFYALIAATTYSDSQFYILGWGDVYHTCPTCPPQEFYYDSWYHYEYRDLYSAPDQVGICLVWGANSFDEWNWPDPEFNGMLPGMTSEEMRSIWRDYLGFYFSKSVCDTVGLRLEW